MASIGLCMIVRDEEAMLGECLASVKGAVDDMVVVDTGSRDRTKQVATDAGARVFDFAWCDDFSAARNEALKYVRAQWVLVLDADERLAPGSDARLRGVVDGAKFDCGMLRLHDAARLDASLEDVVSGRERQAEVQLVPRLLRRADGLKYADAIHENVNAWVRRRGTKVAGVEVDIVHYGATQAVVDAKSKLDRNVTMLRARLERSPGDLAAHGYLAHDLIRARLLPEARGVIERGWAQIDASERRRSDLQIHRLATARAYRCVGSGEYEAARETMRIARAIEGDNPDYCFLSAYASESEAARVTGPARSALLVTAREGYRECVRFAGRVFAQSFVFGASSWCGATRLGSVELVLGNPVQASQAFEVALNLRPDAREAQLGRAEALIDTGAAAAALQALDGQLDDASADAWTLAAVAVKAMGLSDDARLFVRRAQSLLGKGFLAWHRRERLHVVARSLTIGAVSQA